MSRLIAKGYSLIWAITACLLLVLIFFTLKESQTYLTLVICVTAILSFLAAMLSSLYLFKYQCGNYELTKRIAAQNDELSDWSNLEVKPALNQDEDYLEQQVAERTFELEIALRELQEANASLEKLNREDSLTGLFNRRHFDKQLTLEFRKAWRQQEDFCLFMLDIDHFKKINDQYGHLIGDQVLVEVAHRLQQTLQRPTDSIFRYGGEEFVIIISPCQEEEATYLAQKTCQAIGGKPFQTDMGDLKLTASLGVCHVSYGFFAVPEQALSVADEALYQAKKNGRNQFVIAEKTHANEF